MENIVLKIVFFLFCVFINGFFALSEIAYVSGYETPYRRRSDGSWIVSGSLPIEAIEDKIGLKTEEKGGYKTVAGLLLHLFGRIPKEGDAINYKNLRFEVIDMDDKRIDKILISYTKKE